MIGTSILALLCGMGTLYAVKSRQVSNDRMAAVAVQAIMAAKTAYLEEHPGTPDTTVLTDEQLVPLLSKGGHFPLEAESNRKKSGVKTLFPSPYVLTSIGAINQLPTVTPAVPNVAGVSTGPIRGIPPITR